MNTTIETFNHLKRDVEQSFQRIQSIKNSSQFDNLFNHIACTLDDLEKLNQILLSSSSFKNENESEDENATLIEKTQSRFTIGYSKKNDEESLLSSSDVNEREDFIQRMKIQLDSYKNEMRSEKKVSNTSMDIIQLEENDDRIIRQEDDEKFDTIHHKIVSLRNLTQNINFELDDHVRVLENLETNMIHSQNHVQNLTKQTTNFVRTKADGIGGSTYLFGIAVSLFFLIIILLIFF